MNHSPYRPLLPGLLAAAFLAAGPAARPAETAPARRAAFSSFSVIAERNIFNAGRSGRRSSGIRETRRATRVDAFGLVGVLRSEKGPFAFFDGSGSEYRKALAPGGTLAGFKLVEIQPGAVTLQAGTNLTELRMGMQLRREEEGEWRVSERSDSFASSGSSSGPPASGRPSDSAAPSAGAAPSSGGGDADEVLKRLLQKREQESK
jgi:hypothetical protein